MYYISKQPNKNMGVAKSVAPANAVPLLTQARPAMRYAVPLFSPFVNILTNFETIEVRFVSPQ